MKKRIGIITITDYNNYGNRLQNYATQEFLKIMGHDTITIKNTVEKKNNTNNSSIKKIADKKISEIATILLTKIKNKKNRKIFSKIFSIRKRRFIDFTKKYIKETEYTISINNIDESFLEEFDYFVSGSDQVWNPIFRNASPIDFMTFAPKKKRIAFSPSFGISTIPNEYKERYTNWLNDIAALSVREETGAKIIKELTGRNAEVLVDPTLLLSREDWLKITSKPKGKPTQKYLFTYFLGDISNNNKEWINSVAKQGNLEVVNLMDFHNKDMYVVDPSEFIDLIYSATLVCTDSFHGSVFSIIMETPFIVFDRVENNEVKMSSRIETLLKTIQLEDRHFNRISNDNNIFQIDFTHTKNIILKEQTKAYKYLTKAFQ